MADHAKALARAAARYVDAKAARDAAIREASASGMTYRAIAEIAGLSHQRIAQIVHASS
jgi:hypothetical protein